MYLLDNKEKKYNFNSNLIIMISNVDYNFIGIIYILIFYYTKDFDKLKRLKYTSVSLFVTNLLTFGFGQQYAILALPLIYFYNGKLGPNNKFLQIFFYIAYPLHLLIFNLLK